MYGLCQADAECILFSKLDLWHLIWKFSDKWTACVCYRVNDLEYFFPLVHVDDNASAHSDPVHFESWLAHFGGDPTDDSYLNVNLLGDVASVLQLRIVRAQSSL